MSSDQPFYLTQNAGFGRALPEDDFLHPAKNKLVTDKTLTETQYFGFSVPEAQIQGAGYLWHHPNLGTVSGGLYVWRGDKFTAAAAELCAYTDFMSDAALKNDLQNYRLENGYGVEVLEPLKRHRMTYSDSARKNSVDLIFEAISPPVMFRDGNHMEQPMKVNGELVLRGKTYAVDCHCIRDRSWAKPRREDNFAMPPLSWMTGVFNKDFAFVCSMFDQAAQNTELKGSFAMPEDKTLSAGWILRNGNIVEVVSAKKRVERDPHTLLALAIDLEMTGADGTVIKVRGTRLNTSFPWHIWPTMNVVVCVMQWECDGLTTCGENQEAHWSDYIQEYAQ